MSPGSHEAPFVTDSLWTRGDKGLTLVAGVPVTFFRVTAPGARVLDALELGDPLPIGHDALTARLSAAGAIHPIPRRTAPEEEVTVVIPTFTATDDDAGRLRELVDSLASLRIVVVDDCSPVDPGTALAGSRAELARLETNRGPGAARNAGLALVTTPVVVFIDDDVAVTADDVLLLAGLVLDGHASLVAPRVGTAHSDGAIADYEKRRSPLDMGGFPAIVRPGGRVPYVPSAVVACEVGALRAVGAFDDAMRTGEDVDLVWRMIDAGHTCRYVPSVRAAHVPRRTVHRFLRQRSGYGRSAADLAHRHGRRLAPFRSHVVTAVPAALALLAYPFASVLAAAVALAWLAVTLRSSGIGVRHGVRLAWTSLVSVTSMLARAIRREWWPIVLVAALFWERAVFALMVSYLVPVLVHLVRDRPRRVFSDIVLGILDDVSYGAGVWAGALARRRWGFLLPVLSLRTGTRR